MLALRLYNVQSTAAPANPTFCVYYVHMFRRDLLPVLRDALSDSRVTLIQGPRQSGKTTLAMTVAAERDAVVHTLDLATTRAAAESDPARFLHRPGEASPRGGSPDNRLTIIDEIQKLPELVPAIKIIVDRDPRPGQFLLTGSASVLSLPRLSDSLAGRMRVLTLWPLSQREVHIDDPAMPTFIDRAFDDGDDATDAPSRHESTTRALWLRPGERGAVDVRSVALHGGFPERLSRVGGAGGVGVGGGVGGPHQGDPLLEHGWYQSYLTTILERDIREFAEIRTPTDLLRLLTMVATRTGSLLNNADLSRSLGLVDTTLRRFLALLEKVFLVARVPAWTVSLDQRIVKSPKVYLTDTGLFSHLLEIDRERLDRDPTLAGPLMETFVFTELIRQLGASRVRATIHHFRTPDRREVDFVLERAAGQIVGIEVKAAAAVSAHDFKGLTALKALAGDRMVRGIVLYAGNTVVPFGPGMWAVPIQAMWEGVG